MLPSIFGESMFDDMFDRAFDMDAMFGGKNPCTVSTPRI